MLAPSADKKTRVFVVVISLVVGILTALAIIQAIDKQSSSQTGTAKQTAIQSGFSTVSGVSEPHWVLPKLDGLSQTAQLSSDQFTGKPLVLNFWASWCVPCQSEMPALENVSKVEGALVQFVGINTADQRQPATTFLARTGVTYPVAYDPNSTLGSKFGVFGLPVTIFIGPNGNVVGREVGALTAEQLQNILHQLFKIKIVALAP